MSGESPREEKTDDVVTCNSAGAENKPRAIGDTVAPTLERQRSRQQLMACWPLGQHESCDASECPIAVVWQSVDIDGEVAANAAIEPCRPMANIKIRAMISRFMPHELSWHVASMQTSAPPCDAALKSQRDRRRRRAGICRTPACNLRSQPATSEPSMAKVLYSLA
jgi:hypothetical protein